VNHEQIRAELKMLLAGFGAVASVIALALFGHWELAICAGACVGSVVYLSRHVLSRDRLAVGAAIASAVAVFVIFSLAHSRSQARHELRTSREEAAALRQERDNPPYREFMVYSTEVSPTGSSFDERYAYEFAEPDTTTVIEGDEHEKFSSVKVKCRVKDDDWYLLADHHFMQDSAIKPVVALGQQPPPTCPEVDGERTGSGPYG
jgi:hypothetical protein